MPISERELSIAMSGTGRRIGASTLAEWRQKGLLPPFATRSQGLNKGRLCYWPGNDTIDCAFLIHDCLKDGRKSSEVLWLLWLLGFAVPLKHLRRAWLHRAKANRLRAARPKLRGGKPSFRTLGDVLETNDLTSGGISPDLLFDAAAMVCESLEGPGRAEIDALAGAVDRLMSMKSAQFEKGEARGRHPKRRMLSLLHVVWSALQTSDLMAIASDEELHDAQRYACAALRLLHEHAHANGYTPRAGAPDWPIAEAESFGAPLFFLVLIMLRTGRRAVLDLLLPEATGLSEDRRQEDAQTVWARKIGDTAAPIPAR